MRWHLLLSPPLDGPANMALDHALMQRAGMSGEAVLRVYTWATPVLSLGRNQRAVDLYDLAALTRASVTVVRRPSGGRALLHHREVTYSVTAPGGRDARPDTSYSRINALLLAGLAELGVAAAIAAPVTRAMAPGPQPCFAEPAAGEITANGGKLVGSAQWRDGGALLQHGSIIVEDDQARIAGLMRAPTAPSPAPATLRELMGRVPSPGEVAGALFDALRRLEDPEATMLSSDALAGLEVASLEALYRDPTWTWRR